MKKVFIAYFLCFMGSLGFMGNLAGFVLFDDDEDEQVKQPQQPTIVFPPTNMSTPQTGPVGSPQMTPQVMAPMPGNPQQPPATQLQPAVAQPQPTNLPTVSVPPITPPQHIKPGPLMFKGCFSIRGGQQEKIPSFRIFFEGKEVKSDEEGFFAIPVDEDKLEKFKLVISKTLHQNFDQHNTVKNFNLVPDKNYLYYSFKKRGPFGGAWVQRAKNLIKKQFVIPNNAIIILLDPKYIDHLEPWNINFPHNFIKLPKIVLKAEVKNKSIERASAKSLLNALDAIPFHEEIKEVAQRDPNNPKIKITAPQ